MKRHLESRRGYTLCFLHVAFLAVFVAVLALHVETPSIWEVRRAIHRNIFAPGTVGGEDVTSVDTVVLDSRDDVTDWFLQTFIVGDGDEVFSDPACGDGVCTLPLEHAIWRDPTQQVCTVTTRSRLAVCVLPRLVAASASSSSCLVTTGHTA